MKVILALALVLCTLTCVYSEIHSEIMKSGDWGVTKMSSLQIRQVTFVGGKGWQNKDTTKKETQPQYYIVNMTRSPFPAFVVNTTSIDKIPLGPKDKDTVYQVIETKKEWSVQKNVKDVMDGFGHLYTESNELTVQRAKYQVCAYYQDGVASEKTMVYTLKNCQITDIGELHENKNFGNWSVEIQGWGTVHMWMTYNHAGPLTLPKYVTNAKINKIKAFTNPTAKLITDLAFKVQLGSFAQSWTGQNTQLWDTGFCLTDLNPKTLSTSSISEDLTVQLFVLLKYDTTTAQSQSNYWSAAEPGCGTATFSLDSQCGRTVQLVNKAFEIDVTVTCSMGYILKFAFAMLFMFAGLLML